MRRIREDYGWYIERAREAAKTDGVYPVFKDKWGTETYEKGGSTWVREVVVGQERDYIESHKVLQPYIAAVLNYHFDRDFTYDEWQEYREECGNVHNGYIIEWRTGTKIPNSQDDEDALVIVAMMEENKSLKARVKRLTKDVNEGLGTIDRLKKIIKKHEDRWSYRESVL